MKPLLLEKAYAVKLRKAGRSYSEILSQVPVSKSSLSLWLQNLPLTDAEKSSMKGRRDASISRGRIRAAASLHKKRLDRDRILYIEAQSQYREFASDPFFHFGLALYWAEGTKRGGTFTFTNSEPEMIALMVRWMDKYLGVTKESISARLHIHKPYAGEELESYWSERIGIPRSNFRKTIYKPTSKLIKLRSDYKGCLRIEVCRVAYLRKYQFWLNMLLVDSGKQG